jgi:signal transduction histidine kinase
MAALREVVASPVTLGRAALLAAVAAWAGAGLHAAAWPAAGAVLAALLVVALWLGPRVPVATLAVAFAALFAAGTVGVAEDVYLAGVVWACYLVGRHARLRHQPWAAAAVLLLLSANLLDPGRDPAAADAVFPVLLTAFPWVLGLTVQLARRREASAVEHARAVVVRRSDDIDRATAEERLRIARELHDVVAHGMSAVSLQAQVARRAAEAGREVDVDLLRSVERSAQEVMSDVRRLLGVLRVPAEGATEPVPGIEALTGLVAECHRLGQPVRFTESGVSRGLPPALSAAAYRIVQECLTNARRHGGPGATSLLLDWQEHELRLTVRNPVGSDPVAAGTGSGLRGLEERVRMWGGHSEVRRGDGTWLVEVVLPVPVAMDPVR